MTPSTSGSPCPRCGVTRDCPLLGWRWPQCDLSPLWGAQGLSPPVTTAREVTGTLQSCPELQIFQNSSFLTQFPINKTRENPTFSFCEDDTDRNLNSPTVPKAIPACPHSYHRALSPLQHKQNLFWGCDPATNLNPHGDNYGSASSATATSRHGHHRSGSSCPRCPLVSPPAWTPRSPGPP